MMIVNVDSNHKCYSVNRLHFAALLNKYHVIYVFYQLNEITKHKFRCTCDHRRVLDTQELRHFFVSIHSQKQPFLRNYPLTYSFVCLALIVSYLLIINDAIHLSGKKDRDYSEFFKLNCELYY